MLAVLVVFSDRALGVLTFIAIPLLRAASQNALPLTLYGTRDIFLYLNQSSSELVTGAEVFLTLLTKLVSRETEAGETRPGWMRAMIAMASM